MDGVTSWEKSISSGRILDIAIHPTNGNIIYALKVNSSSQLEFLKSTDGGKTFTEKNSGLPDKSGYEIFNQNGQRLYFGRNHGRQTFTINFTGIISGSYIIRISGEDGYSITRQFIVK